MERNIVRDVVESVLRTKDLPNGVSLLRIDHSSSTDVDKTTYVSPEFPIEPGVNRLIVVIACIETAEPSSPQSVTINDIPTTLVKEIYSGLDGTTYSTNGCDVFMLKEKDIPANNATATVKFDVEPNNNLSVLVLQFEGVNQINPIASTDATNTTDSSDISTISLNANLKGSYYVVCATDGSGFSIQIDGAESFLYGAADGDFSHKTEGIIGSGLKTFTAEIRGVRPTLLGFALNPN